MIRQQRTMGVFLCCKKLLHGLYSDGQGVYIYNKKVKNECMIGEGKGGEVNYNKECVSNSSLSPPGERVPNEYIQ